MVTTCLFVRIRKKKRIARCAYVVISHPLKSAKITSAIPVIPATAVLAADAENLWSIPTWNYRIIFFNFAICWFGDPRFQLTDPVTLEGLRTLLDARAALRFVGQSTDEGIDASLM
jgi:hypothetical protein